MIKRVFDLVLAFAMLVVLSPVMVALSVAVKLGSAGPVLYKGVRCGRGGRPFRMLKFRSMVVDAERLGGPSTSGDDPRLTSVGRFMRRSKLDELPQLVNILRGDMSFVGPRPEVLSEIATYTVEQREILILRPGITDWASLWNVREEEVLAGAPDPHQAYKELIQPTKLMLQLQYCRQRSFGTDLQILGSTALKIVRGSWTPGPLKALPPLGKPVVSTNPNE